VDKAEISGVESFIESSIKNAVSELSVSAMYTWSEAKDRNTQHFLTNVPKKKFTFNFKYRIYGTSITIMSANVGERYSDAANTKSIAAYNISNVILTQTVKFLGSSVSVDLGVYNVFNKDYMVMDGYPMPKRNFRAGLRILF
jgi:outer membrane receptor for ferrienterochelin and colicins